MVTTSAFPITVDGVRLDTLAYNVADLGGWRSVPGLRSADQQLPGSDGVLAALNEDYEPAMRSLTMRVMPRDADGLVGLGGRAQFDKNLDDLLALFAVRHRLLDVRITQGDGSVRQRLAKVQAAIPVDVDGIGYQAELRVVLMVPGVFDQDVATADWASGTLTSGTPKVVTTLAGGTAPVKDAVLLLKGPATNPTITDTTTGATLSLAGTLTASQAWRVDVGAWSSTRGTTTDTTLAAAGPTGALAETTYTGRSRFLSLTPTQAASTSVAVTAGGITTGTALTVRARRKFL